MIPNLKLDVKITGNPVVDGFILRTIGYLASGIAINAAVWLKNHGYVMDVTVLTQFLIGGGVALTVFILSQIKGKGDMAKAAQGALNLVLAGQAVTQDGTAITQIGDPAAAPPLAVTPAAAVQIAKLAT